MLINRICLSQGTVYKRYYNSFKGRLVPYRLLEIHREGKHVRRVNLSENGFRRVLRVVRKVARRRAWAYAWNHFEKWNSNNGFVDHYSISIVRQDSTRKSES